MEEYRNPAVKLNSIIACIVRAPTQVVSDELKLSPQGLVTVDASSRRAKRLNRLGLGRQDTKCHYRLVVNEVQLEEVELLGC